MYCTKCGAEIPDDALFCTACGEKIDHEDEAASETTEGGNKEKMGTGVEPNGRLRFPQSAEKGSRKRSDRRCRNRGLVGCRGLCC